MVREFVNKEVIPYVHKWDEAKSMPKEFLQVKKTRKMEMQFREKSPEKRAVKVGDFYGIEKRVRSYFS